MQKVLLITGASSEVGMQLLENCYHDYEVIYAQYCHMNERLEQLLCRLQDEIKVVPIQADFSDIVQVEKMISQIKETGQLPNHIVHLPFPKVYNTHFHKDAWENYANGWEISVHAVFMLLQAFIPAMSKNRYGRIVFMLTSNTVNDPAKYQAGYVTVKYALLGLMKALSVEYAAKGITVNGVSPDMMETKFLSELPHLIVEQNAANSPIGRNIRIEEIVPVFQYLLSDAGAAMTGENIAIRGGM